MQCRSWVRVLNINIGEAIEVLDEYRVEGEDLASVSFGEEDEEEYSEGSCTVFILATSGLIYHHQRQRGQQCVVSDCLRVNID